MKRRIEKMQNRGCRQYMIKAGFAYVGRRFDLKDRQPYQVGFSFWMCPTMYFNSAKKPIVRNLLVINIGLFIPYLLFVGYNILKALVMITVWFLIYVTIGSYPQALRGFGWGGEYLIVPILFWQIISIGLGAYIMLK